MRNNKKKRPLRLFKRDWGTLLNDQVSDLLPVIKADLQYM